MLDQAFEALATYDWGADRKLLQPIDEAVVTTHGDEPARRELERRLAAVLTSSAGRAAKDFVCRKLMVLGTASSVAALAKLLPDEELSHMARYALERIDASEAAAAMRDALSRLEGTLLAGAIGSLGVRRDTASVPLLAALVGDADPVVACAAATALGDIRTPDAADALKSANPTDANVRRATTDASLACAEGLLASGMKDAAKAIYLRFASGDQPKHVRLAATRGMLACAGSQ